MKMSKMSMAMTSLKVKPESLDPAVSFVTPCITTITSTIDIIELSSCSRQRKKIDRAVRETAPVPLGMLSRACRALSARLLSRHFETVNFSPHHIAKTLQIKHPRNPRQGKALSPPYGRRQAAGTPCSPFLAGTCRSLAHRYYTTWETKTTRPMRHGGLTRESKMKMCHR